MKEVQKQEKIKNPRNLKNISKILKKTKLENLTTNHNLLL
jgi:hypothetical protein